VLLKKQRLLATFTTLAALLSSGAVSSVASTASAATTTQILVTHNAYLRSQPKSASHHIALERAGNELTVLSGSTPYWWHVIDSAGRVGYITKNAYYTAPVVWSHGAQSGTNSTAGSIGFVPSSAANTTKTYQGTGAASSTFQLPPGVTLDPNIQPLAPLNSSDQAKFDAIMKVAESKLGTPYQWGHNEDRGQFGFDCSNFTAYVYHHALGYRMSTSSRTQYSSVGWNVPIQDMRPGDLVVFNQGGHVGIYAGNGMMIQEGGGLGKVGYLKLAPGSYWYQHISAVKRMY
jgi:cell wall-associated NlpC family hydrolase